jgi:4-diphosphocytidyl-2-C-methyl-D-erythritol kinase
MSSSRKTVTAAAPAKINLILRVGTPDDSGYHPLVTVFQAVDMWDEVTITPADTDQLSVRGSKDVTGVPTDQTNIVWKAVDAVSQLREHREPLAITIAKSIPVAGGMAGGSADAAATLVALNELWQMGLAADKLSDIATTLGADVPFSLQGGLALGHGRGDVLTPLTRGQPLHLVVVTSALSLSTPLVYKKVDELRSEGEVRLAALTDQELARVTGEDVESLAGVVSNDLQSAAFALAPQIHKAVDALNEAGALASLVSGSGPTVFGVCVDAAQAKSVASELQGRGFMAQDTVSTTRGARLTSFLSSPTEGH